MEKYLLDTHTLLWYLESNPLLSKKALETIVNIEKTCLVSHVSLWEIAIKLTIGKLNLSISFNDLEAKLLEYGFHLLPISTAFIVKYSELPLHHRDPFDRLLIAQAIVEKLPVLGNDSVFDAYPIQRVW